MLADPAGTLCGPARRWHEAYFAACAATGYAPIASLSYELLAEHCPDAWQQRAYDGTPARTGWDPRRVIHVGDSLHSDVGGAKTIGLLTGWLCREDRILDVLIPPPRDIGAILLAGMQAF